MGYPHPDKLLEEITSYQLSEWEAFARLEPFGFDSDTDRLGILATVVANCMATKKDGTSFQPSDFFKKPEEILKEMEEETEDQKIKRIKEMKAVLMQLVPIDKRDHLDT